MKLRCALLALVFVCACEVDDERGLPGLSDERDAAVADAPQTSPDAPALDADAALVDAPIAETGEAPDAAPACGNGKLESSEACDDGNQSQTDGCLNDCQLPRCGDGQIQAGVEECDDGNQTNTDGCLNTCKNPVCGDGHVRAGVESCDDGNRINTDACTNECALPGCGDGIVQPNEVCDDGNRTNNDACTNACQAPRCGDSIVQANEGCDDGNTNNNDACLDNCTLSKCQPSPNVDDGNPCTTDSCDPFLGVRHVPVAQGTLCPDNDVCDNINKCNASGQCAPTPAPPVDDGNPCTTDTCNRTTGPVHTPVAEGTACPDDNLCDRVNRCTANAQCVETPAPVIDTSNPCRVGSCDPKRGPVYENAQRGTSCADTNICNGAETCDGQGNCQAGANASARTSCDDGNVCNGINRCDGQGTCQLSQSTAPRGASCSVGDTCLVCNGQGVCEQPTAQNLDDGNGCTVDMCDAAKGAVHVDDSRLNTACSTCCTPGQGLPQCFPCRGTYLCSNSQVVCQPIAIR